MALEGQRRLALVTGASAGIGAAFAKLLADKGFDVALTARRLDKLEALAAELKAKGVDAFAIAADLSQPGAVDQILADIGKRGGSIDVLINNAGYGLPGTWRGTSWSDQAAALQVMLTAPLELSHKVLPGMAQRGYGRIANIASLAGMLPGARGHTTYGAIKAALIRFSQSLNVENEGSGVNVTAVCPGLTLSEFHDVNATRERMNRTPKWLWQTSERVAEIGWRAVERNRRVVVTGVPNKIAAVIARIVPDDVLLGLAKNIRGPQD